MGTCLASRSTVGRHIIPEVPLFAFHWSGHGSVGSIEREKKRHTNPLQYGDHTQCKRRGSLSLAPRLPSTGQSVRLFRVRHHSFACCVLLVSILLASAAAEAETVANYCCFFFL